MKHYLLKNLQETKAGFTDLVVLTYADMLTGTDDAALDIELFDLQAGDVVFPKTTLEIVTAFGGTLTGDTIKLSVGRTGTAYVDLLAASQVSTTGTGAAAKSTFSAAAGLTNDPIAANDTTVYCQLTITAGTTHLTGLTAGEFRIWLSISRWNERDVVA